MSQEIVFLKAQERSKISELRKSHPELPIFLLQEEIPRGEDFFKILEEGFTGVLRSPEDLKFFAHELS